jgi:hypothetical protein
VFTGLNEEGLLLAAVLVGVIVTVVLVVRLEDRLQSNAEPGPLTRRIMAWWHGS